MLTSTSTIAEPVVKTMEVDRGGTKIGGALRELFAPHSHDASDSIDGALESCAAGIRAVKISLLALGATAIMQLVILAISGSVALLADTVHNFSDALTAVPLWIAFALGRRAGRQLTVTVLAWISVRFANRVNRKRLTDDPRRRLLVG